MPRHLGTANGPLEATSVIMVRYGGARYQTTDNAMSLIIPAEVLEAAQMSEI